MIVPSTLVSKRPSVSALPAQGSRRVYARDDQVGGAKSPTAAASLLVVEDDFLLAMESEIALRGADYDVGEVASSAEEALKAAASRPFTLAVIDVRLASRMDGIDCAIELFKRYGLRCIFATAHYDDETRRRAEAARPLGWLHKPYTMSSLVFAVRDALDQLGGKH
jgi:two-component system, response regulator PdtaR